MMFTLSAGINCILPDKTKTNLLKHTVKPVLRGHDLWDNEKVAL